MISRIASIIVWVATALWLGGMIFLFIAVQTLFRAFPKTSSNVAMQGAPALFGAFEKYQLALAAVAVIACFAWYVASRSRLLIAIFLLLALSAAGGVVSTTLITPKMEHLRMSGASSSSRFAQLHARSMQCYVAQAGFLLVAAMLIPMVPAAPRRTARGSSAAAASPP